MTVWLARMATDAVFQCGFPTMPQHRRGAMKAANDKSLASRIFIPIVLANIAVWLIFLTQDILEEATIDIWRRTAEVEERSAMLETCTTEQEAIMLAKVLAAVHEWSPDVPILFELWTAKNQRLFFNQKNLRFTYVPLQGDPNKITEVVANGHKYNLIRHDGPRWSLRVAVPQPLQPLHEYIAEYAAYPKFSRPLALSFSVLLLALWLAASRGLLPLRLLALRVAERPVSDLSPLHFDARYAELKPMAAALDAMLLQLKGSVEREQSFILHAAQQLDSPMEQINALVQVLASESSVVDKQLAVQQIDQAIARTSHLIQQLLEMARVEGLPVQDRQTQDMAQLVRQYLAKIVPAARARNIALVLEAPQNLPHCVERNSFQLIFHNLLDNAIRYGPVGGMVEIELKKDGDDLLLSVADDGPGIDINQRERVFERFYRGAESDSFGSGLGLAIVRQAATRMGATVEILDGLQGRGCFFLVRIPGEKSPSSGPHQALPAK
jgi:signal transduction histidine kinase